MRKIKYRKKIKNTSTISKDIKISDFELDGTFHLWTTKKNIYKYGEGEVIVALVEIGDGTIVEILPCNIKFINE